MPLEPIDRTPGRASVFGDMLRSCLEDRSLERIRRCKAADCGNWFMETRKGKMHCSRRCGKKPKSKADAAEYQRNRRRMERIRVLLDRSSSKTKKAQLNAEYKLLLTKRGQNGKD